MALRTGQCAASKGEAVLLYRAHVDEPWADFVSEVYSTCKEAWGYRVPEDAAGRHHLRDLCRRAPAFEMQSLTSCREYMIACLRGDKPDQKLWAMQALRRLTGPDTDVPVGLTDMSAMDESR